MVSCYKMDLKKVHVYCISGTNMTPCWHSCYKLRFVSLYRSYDYQNMSKKVVVIYMDFGHRLKQKKDKDSLISHILFLFLVIVVIPWLLMYACYLSINVKWTKIIWNIKATQKNCCTFENVQFHNYPKTYFWVKP
jgi:hypothetical protein